MRDGVQQRLRFVMGDKHTQTDQDRDDRSRRKRMHEDVQTWADTCSCEPEPRWQAVEDERDHKDMAGGDHRD